MQNDYAGEERRKAHPLTEEQMNAVAELAAEKALEKVYSEVGKSIVKKLFWVAGAVAIGLVYFLGGKGIPLK